MRTAIATPVGWMIAMAAAVVLAVVVYGGEAPARPAAPVVRSVPVLLRVGPDVRAARRVPAPRPAARCCKCAMDDQARAADELRSRTRTARTSRRASDRRR